MEIIWFKLARIRLGLSQEDIAKELGTTRLTIINIEKGKITTGITFKYYKLYLETELRDLPKLGI